MLQVEVGPIGSEQQAQRERMLRSSIELQTQLKQSQQKLEALTQQLASTPSEAQDAHVSANSAEPHPHSATAAGQAKPRAAAASQQTGALMASLFGTDDDQDSSDDNNKHIQVKLPASKQQGGSAAGAAQQRRQTTAVTAQSKGVTAGVAGPRFDAKQGGLPSAAAVSQGGSSNRAQGSTAPKPGPGPKPLDPAAPRRSISFSSSLRRRQASAVQHRRDAFNEAADAALIRTLALRSTAGAQAHGSAAEQPPVAAAANPEADESSHVLPQSITHKQPHAGLAGTELSQAPLKDTIGPASPSVPDQASKAVPSALPQQPSGTQDLPGGRVQPAAALPSSSSAMAEGPPATEAPGVITRTSQAEPAPKLKTGSRLAASMAKLAASKRAPNDELPLPAATAQVKQSDSVEKKTALSEDVKRALLAKVC